MIIKKHIAENNLFYVKEFLAPPQSCLEAEAPESTGWPFIFLQKVSVDGEWKTKRDGTKKFTSKVVCKIPEYFQEAFGDTETMCCNICEQKCTRMLGVV